MKFSYLFVIPALLLNQVALANTDSVYKWKFVQNNEITKLSFKNDESSKNETNLRKVISRGFTEEFCSTEKNLLKTHFKDMSKSCDIKEKEITEEALTAQMVCEEKQNIKFRVRKQPEGHYEGISRVHIDNDDFILQGYSMIKIKKLGNCSEEEIAKSKKKK